MKEFFQKKLKNWLAIGIVILLMAGVAGLFFLNKGQEADGDKTITETDSYTFEHLALGDAEVLNNHNDIGVMISDCDSAAGFINYGNISFINKKGMYVQGKGAMHLTNLRYKDVTPWAKFAPLDISSCEGGSIHMSLYISDPAYLMGNNITFELTSGGNCDIDELSWALGESNLKAGWNELYLGIDDATKVGKPDLTKMNFIRLYTKGAKMGLEVMVDALYATKTKGTWTKPPVPTASTKPGLLLDFDTLKGIFSSGVASLADKPGIYKEGVAALSVKNPDEIWAQARLIPADLSGYEDGRLTVWVYINNTDYIKKGIMWLEISSSGTFDKNEMVWGIEGKQLKEGWNELTFNFANAGHTNPKIDLKNVNFIRIYGTGCEKELEVMLDAVSVWEPMTRVPEDGMLFDGDTLEEFFKVSGNTAVVTDDVKQGSGALQRTATSDVWFSCTFRDYIDITKFGNGGLHAWVYVDDAAKLKSPVTIEITSSGTYDKDEYQWAVSGLKDGWNELLLPFADASVKGTPNLGKLNYVRIFAAISDDVTIKLDDFHAVMDATEKVPEGTTVDTAVEGMIYSGDSGLYSKASGSGRYYEITREEGEYLQGTGAFKNVGLGEMPLLVRLKQPKDISAYADGGIQFSLYIEDKSVIASTDMYFEISSAAKSDVEELQWRILLSGLSDGWNTITLENAKASKRDTIDFTQVDYIRVFMGKAQKDMSAVMIFDDIHAVSREELESMKNVSNIRGMLLDCDSMQTAQVDSHSQIAVTTKVEEHLQGSGAIKTTGKGQDRLSAILNQEYDISAYKKGGLELSVYINNLSLLTSSSLKIELTSAGRPDAEELCWTIPVTDLNDGWNTLHLDFAGVADPNVIDYTAVDFLRIYFNKNEQSADLVCIIDDVHVVKEAEASDNRIAESIYNCDSSDNVEINSDGTLSVTTSWTESMEGTGAIKAEGTTLIWLSTVFEPLDMTDYAGGGIRFWLNISNPKLLTGSPKVTVELGSAGEADVAEYQWEIATASLKKGWQEIYLDFASADVVGSVDLSQINYFRIYGGANEGLTVIVDSIDAAMQATQVCAYLTDGAVYQAEKPLSIWGSASIGVTIKAELYKGSSLLGGSAVTTTGETWSLELPGQPGGYTEYTVKIYENGVLNSECTGILFGEVWLAAGQSNMQLLLRDSYDGKEQMSAANDEYLRIFHATAMPAGNGAVTVPASDIDGAWVLGQSNDSRLGNVSAVAYNFALGLRKELDVPVAIMETSLGSTPIEAWLSKEMVDTDAELKAEMQKLGVYKTPTTYTDLGAMYYSKIAPLTNANIAGVIWYQGEGNAGRAAIYADQMDLLKAQWGTQFGFENDSMPFVFTQLAPYSFSGSTNQMLLTGMMDAMSEFYHAHEDTVAMVTNYDLSLRYTDTTMAQAAVIHPTVKKPVGERMALAALGLVYGEAEATAPTLASYEMKDGKAILKFEHVGTGLKVYNDSIGVLGFALCDAEGIWVNATAEIIDGTTVEVYSDYIDEPLYVSYAYCDMNTDANLCASNGIPAAPFKTGGTGGLGSRSYLNCDEDDFVVTSFATANNEVGHGEYKNLWTVLNRASASYDEDTHVQGIASVKGTYEAGTDEVVIGVDLTEAGKYSVTAGLKNIGAIAVRMKNGDARDKAVRLCLETSDGTIAYTNAKTLEANANFATLEFDLTRLSYADGSVVQNCAPICINMRKLSFCTTDEEAGTIWIDDIKLDGKASAEDADVAVMLLDCDSMSDATFTSESAIAVTTATGEYLQGGGAIKTTGKGQMRMAAKFNEAKDISAYQTGGLELSIYINDKSLLASTNLKVELTSGGQADLNEMCWSPSLAELSNGWNTLRLDFDTNLNNMGGLNFANANYFRVYFNKNETNTGLVVIIDDVHVYENEVTVPGMILDCDDTNDVTVSSSGALSVTTTANEFQQGKGAYKSVNPSLIWYRAILENSVDVSAYQTGGLHLWMYISDPTLITGSEVKVELSSNETDNNDEYEWDIPVSSLKAGWQEVYLDFASRTGTIDLSKVKRLHIYAEATTGLTVMLDDVRAVEQIVSDDDTPANEWYIVDTPTEVTSSFWQKTNCNLQLNKTVADEKDLMLYVTLDIPQDVYDKLQAGNRFVVEIAQTTNDQYEYEFRFPLENIDLKVGENVLAMSWDKAAETSDAKGNGTPSLGATMNFCKLYYQNYATGPVSIKGTTIKEIKIVYNSPETEYSIVDTPTEVTSSLWQKTNCNLQLNKTVADEKDLMLYVTLDIPQDVYDNLQAGNRFVVEIAQTTNDQYEYEFRFPLENIDLKVGENVLAMSWDKAAETSDAKGNGTPSLGATMNFCKLYYQNYATGPVSIKGTTIKEIKIIYTEP